MKNEKFRYEIIEHIGVIGEDKYGWTKELNIISWNDRGPKYDIRFWAPGHKYMSRGMTLTKEEFENLSALINK